MLYHVLFWKWAVFSCILNVSITSWVCFFHPPETGRTKTTDCTFEEKTGVLFRFNAGNCFYELKKKRNHLLLPSPRARNDHENSESMLKNLKSKLNFTEYSLWKVFCLLKSIVHFFILSPNWGNITFPCFVFL